MSTEQIQQIEQQIGELTLQLSELRKASPAIAVPNYTFETNAGETTLLDLFGPHEKLFAIHNMGQGCRYCTLWADGFNGLLSHLESAMGVVLLSKRFTRVAASLCQFPWLAFLTCLARQLKLPQRTNCLPRCGKLSRSSHLREER